MAIKVKMLKTTPGSPDNIRVLTYKKDDVVELPDSLARAFVDEMRVAEYFHGGRRDSAPAAAPQMSTKMSSGAPENKMAEAADAAPAKTAEPQAARRV